MDTLYSGKNEEIYQTFSVLHTTSVEPSHLGSTNPRQNAFSKLVEQASAIASVEYQEFRIENFAVPTTTYHTDQNGFSRPTKTIGGATPDPPKFLSAILASQWTPNTMGVDARPRIWDKISKTWLLVDSGAATTIIPPSETDEIDHSINLKTVSGDKLPCYGRRQIQFRFNS